MTYYCPNCTKCHIECEDCMRIRLKNEDKQRIWLKGAKKINFARISTNNIESKVPQGILNKVGKKLKNY